MQRKLAREMVVTTVLSATLGIASAFARAPVPTDTTAPPRFFAAATDSTQTPCFSRQAWRGGWRTSPDARTLYIRVGRSVYRLDLAGSYSLLKDPFSVLINRDSANTICTPLDFRLTVSNRVGAVQTPIVRRMTRLTPQEVEALPKKLRP